MYGKIDLVLLIGCLVGMIVIIIDINTWEYKNFWLGMLVIDLLIWGTVLYFSRPKCAKFTSWSPLPWRIFLAGISIFFTFGVTASMFIQVGDLMNMGILLGGLSTTIASVRISILMITYAISKNLEKFNWEED